MQNNKLILDYSKWRCGGDNKTPNRLGEGDTNMENNEGFRCCLGQFSLQLLPSLKSTDILIAGMPCDLSEPVSLLSYYLEYDGVNEDPNLKNTDLAESAIYINDAQTTTPQDKIVLLKELFLKSGFEIEVINQN